VEESGRREFHEEEEEEDAVNRSTDGQHKIMAFVLLLLSTLTQGNQSCSIVMTHLMIVIESVYSICRDSMDTQYMIIQKISQKL